MTFMQNILSEHSLFFKHLHPFLFSARTILMVCQHTPPTFMLENAGLVLLASENTSLNVNMLILIVLKNKLYMVFHSELCAGSLCRVLVSYMCNHNNVGFQVEHGLNFGIACC